MRLTIIVSIVTLVFTGLIVFLVNPVASSPANWTFTLLSVIGANLFLHRIDFDKYLAVNEENFREVKEDISGLERIRELPYEFQAVRNIAAGFENINLKSSNPFLVEQARRKLGEFENVIKDISSGLYECTPEEEILLTKSIISSASSTLRAVSYEDVDWWNSGEGNSYLRLHLAAIKEGALTDAKRIFIATEEEEERLQSVIKKHEDVGVKAYILRPEQVPAGCLKDFVIYDNSLARLADSPQSGKIGKSARFTAREIEVKAAIDLFVTLEKMVETEEDQ